jgi:hypothetical protein
MPTRIRGVPVVLLALALGCSQPKATPPKEPQGPEQLKGRLEAANKMTNLTDRNQALQSIAEDAATAGAAEIVTAALEGITNLGLRNDTAAECALRLARRGDTKAATTVAESITNLSKRNEVLGKIAKGEP